jgi:alkanesulfonate monooxygenase SsuD/methylene tetrahydromethanopterin reductase-like flavin-dependent oxidoreductase (luciferase family)
LEEAIALYRRLFQPSEQLDRPYVMAGVNVIAADTEGAAQQQLLTRQRQIVRMFVRGGESITDDEADQLLASPEGQPLVHNFKYTAAGTPPAVKAYLDAFAARLEADELIIAHTAPTVAERLRSVQLTAEVMQLTPVAP